ncbi:isoleucine--tRNA ligase [Lentisphaerota bacterium WC36G]|nr:isoleucine--tRNA ligase [Lentisphaerae bacterium WC36]
MFKNVESPNFPKMEEAVLSYWNNTKAFEKSIENREGCEEFVFYDGPPFATGLPHYGHLLTCAMKDVVPRYQTMRGKKVNRSFGWDCHGLPVEFEMEKELNLSGKKDIEDYGVDKFNESCRGIVLRYTAEWEQIVSRMGRWVDFKNGYRTMDLDYMESIWWVFKQLWDQDLIYEGYKILPYCPRCATPLSNFEANQGYEDVIDPAITVAFEAKDMENSYFLAWTTTPWTLSSNMALCVGNDIDYVKVKDESGKYYIVAEARLTDYYKDEAPEVLERFKGKDLVGKTYTPLFDYFADKASEGAFRVISAEFVSTDNGTGIVHIAPGFGEDDAAAAAEFNIPEVCPIDAQCYYTDEITNYAGRYVKDCDKDIIRELKENGKLVHRGQINHSYPHCWRDDSPLIYRAISTWFVRIDKIKDKMIKANSQISWNPGHLKEGRFGKWLENARDWAISRNRYWGTPLPIWRNEETGEVVCIGSVAELEALIGEKVTDIHKHLMDKVEIPAPSGNGVLTRIPEVLDCWFESGSMPYAQQHYPFENKEHFENNYPADFIAEGLDQTRGWFYTLTVLSAALFDKPSFKNVVVNGLILAEDGQKMSKRKKNYPDPMHILNNYGADAMRLFMLGSQVVRGEDLKFSETGVKDILRSVLLPVWNSYSFFVTYANVDNWTPQLGDENGPANPQNPLDKWILSSANEMVEEITESMDNYNLQKSANRFERFVDDLTNWYIRRSRRRFWKSQNDSDKNEAYQTLYSVLLTFCKTAAPFIPYITEEIYQNLKTDTMPESIHHCDFPVADQSRRDVYLEKQMENTMTAVTLGRFLRSQNSLRTRQPLAKAVIVAADDKVRNMLTETSSIIAEELNVKDIEFSSDEAELVVRSAKPNFKALGPKLGKEMKLIVPEIAKLTSAQIGDVLTGESVDITLSSGTVVNVTEAELDVRREEKEGLTVATDSGVTIALDTVLNEDLIVEGLAREIVSKIQNTRKDAGFDVADHIKVTYSTNDELLNKAFVDFNNYIASETLADEIINSEIISDDNCLDINDIACKLIVDKI